MNFKKETLFTALCLVLAIFADYSLFSGPVGISYSVFLAVFYTFFFTSFRRTTFHHKQISGLVFFSILALTLAFAIYSNSLFNGLNFLLVPILVFVHIVLLTNSSPIKWYRSEFIMILFEKVGQMMKCSVVMFTYQSRKIKRRMTDSTYQTGKRIGLGVLLSMPLLFVVTVLLSSADQEFARILMLIPEKLFSLELDIVWTAVKVILLTVGFICFFKVIKKKSEVESYEFYGKKDREWDGIVLSTILLFINLVYLLFVAVQFQYFFSGSLQEGFSYAEYARRGFFELVLVTMINYIILLCTLTFHRQKSRLINGLLTFLITFSVIMLSSAFMRLMLYEKAYGFTTSRILAHAFMIYLFVAFAFTLVKVWAPQLSLARFYILFSILFYVGLNMINIDLIIVTNNIERYEQTEKLDVEYLTNLSYSAIPPLVELHHRDPEIQELEDMLLMKKKYLSEEEGRWQSFNVSRERAKTALEKLE
ncbi:DUF4153 domain-containing protein [Evansella tamaricis]|uniref:DUF4173 domain-containing protein n=1 Tax=Evansella tamaricis TaxID=2069301 RepID=A0ABS6JCX5_9BACI|nr:DUF4173 domain-containing protein [Evansella tamaricis]MBU9711527.1 DUF4173 domain-containing protein [Evansella tamaricis]